MGEGSEEDMLAFPDGSGPELAAHCTVLLSGPPLCCRVVNSSERHPDCMLRPCLSCPFYLESLSSVSASPSHSLCKAMCPPQHLLHPSTSPAMGQLPFPGGLWCAWHMAHPKSHFPERNFLQFPECVSYTVAFGPPIPSAWNTLSTALWAKS